ncbi:hypothetical protein ABVK25_011384 [Lepraria finkii]|uniref:Uncharacterized protein n=1 Tax=Lepraria finkii TaxID=1340010 RepID=A0ABR4APV2_9LECA
MTLRRVIRLAIQQRAVSALAASFRRQRVRRQATAWEITDTPTEEVAQTQASQSPAHRTAQMFHKAFSVQSIPVGIEAPRPFPFVAVLCKTPPTALEIVATRASQVSLSAIHSFRSRILKHKHRPQAPRHLRATDPLRALRRLPSTTHLLQLHPQPALQHLLPQNHPPCHLTQQQSEPA